MLSPRLTNCPECATIPYLLEEINCKVASIANHLYNNTVFALNYSTPVEVMSDLLNYKRILTYKYCNPDYAEYYTVEMIASRVKLLKYK